MQSLNNVKENVKEILIYHPETRGNDNLLIFQYWAHHSKDVELRILLRDLLYDEEALIAKLDSPESIRRCRQKFHHDKEYLPPQSVVDGRRAKEAEVKRWAKE